MCEKKKINHEIITFFYVILGKIAKIIILLSMMIFDFDSLI